MMVGAVDAAIAVCFPVTLVAMCFGNRYSLNVMRVAVELGGDGCALVDGSSVAPETPALAAPLGQGIAVAGHIDTGFG